MLNGYLYSHSRVLVYTALYYQQVLIRLTTCMNDPADTKSFKNHNANHGANLQIVKAKNDLAYMLEFRPLLQAFLSYP